MEFITRSRSVAKKVMRVGRATVFLMGSALIVALVFGMASTAFGANGGNFILGSLNNTATAITKLTGTVGGGPALQVSNPSTNTGSTALDLQVATGKAPMKVNSSTKVTNLNADKLDGQDSSTIGQEKWAVVNADGSLVRGRGNPTVSHPPSSGVYYVKFGSDISKCAYTATVAESRSGASVTVNPTQDSSTVHVLMALDVNTITDMPFHLIVAC
jgi:hypothetical protein